jgi:uncharacterized protein (TIGR00645 family)
LAVAEAFGRPLVRWSERRIAMRIKAWIQASENNIEALIFWSRWLLAPAYLVLCACLIVLTYKTFEEFYELVTRDIHLFNETGTIVQVLTIVDLVLVMNLVLMIVFVGYVNFVSQIHPKNEKEEDWPKWMGYLDYSGLKIQLLGSIIAVSAILLLRTLVELFANGPVDSMKFIWMVGFHLVFVVSMLVAAIVNRLKVHPMEWQVSKEVQHIPPNEHI